MTAKHSTNGHGSGDPSSVAVINAASERETFISAVRRRSKWIALAVLCLCWLAFVVVAIVLSGWRRCTAVITITLAAAAFVLYYRLARGLIVAKVMPPLMARVERWTAMMNARVKQPGVMRK